MTDTEALMWAVEREPAFRSSFLNLTVLDTAPDVDRFRSRMEQAVGAIPRLRQHVVAGNGPMSVPSWADDPDFDIAYHVRRIGAPPPGNDRQLLDMAATIYEDAFDPARPLWQFTIVEGLEGGRAALLAKMHHTITDGVGGVRLSAMFLDLERDAPEPVIPAAEDDADGDGDGATGTSILDRLRRPIDLTRRAAGEVLDSMRNPVDTAQSLMRQVLITDRAHSPLWAGKHSLGRHFEVLQVDLDRAKAAAHKLGGTVNDIYLTGVAGGAGAFHRAKGAPVEEMRVSVPISTRTDKSAGGNDFAPTRVLVPVGDDLTPIERFAVVHERLAGVKNERSLGMAETFAGILTSLPSPLLLRLARQQVETVDFACSNVRGAPFDLYVAGAHVEANYPMGPTAGTAFNATLLSYRNSLDVGLCIDSSVVDDPVLLRDCIKESLEELIAAGS
ncbi:MAG TPA: wax ester/triacylglycerol synthase domain-containing protein [Acidimicrobiales bacterium]|nr:wax ester/triacylglycerol synthase domain-containing protein [Acidimicrobiales bacterium]